MAAAAEAEGGGDGLTLRSGIGISNSLSEAAFFEADNKSANTFQQGLEK
jgi:hypothetical protein